MRKQRPCLDQNADDGRRHIFRFSGKVMPPLGSYPHLASVTLLMLLLAWSQLTGAAWLERMEVAVHDALMQHGRPSPADPRLVFLARDTASASLETAADLTQLFKLDEAEPDSRRALELMVREWPWSREVHALVLDRLIAAGASAVVFDFTFPKASPNDDAFRDSLARHRDRVVVAGNISDETDGNASVFSVPTSTLIPQTSPRDPRVGFDNFWPDLDGIIRHANYRWAIERGVWASHEDSSLAACALRFAGLGADVPSTRNPLRMRFAGPPGTFAPRSIHEIFVPEYWKRTYANGDFFRGTIVIVGAAGNWQQDEHLTPLGMMPGPEIHLNAINAALGRAFIRRTPPFVDAALATALVIAALLMRRRIRRPHVRFLAQLSVTVAWVALAFALYDFASLLIPSLGPLLALNLTAFSGLALDLLVERREKAQLRRTLERYVSRNVVEELVDNPEQFSRSLGGDLRDVTVLFSDIRGFTSKAHEMNSKELVAQLNEYFSVMVDCVFRFGGTLDKFIGDAVMAVWGNARSAGPAADARHAVACAQAMFEELAGLNARWAAEGRQQFQIGIGINSGPVVVGNIGSPQRMEFTVIGDAVNVAWRLQEKTKGEHHLLLGEAVLPLLGDDFTTEIIGEIYPRGDEPVAYARLLADEVATRGSASPSSRAHR